MDEQANPAVTAMRSQRDISGNIQFSYDFVSNRIGTAFGRTHEPGIYKPQTQKPLKPGGLEGLICRAGSMLRSGHVWFNMSRRKDTPA
jgi:hypothetical protein